MRWKTFLGGDLGTFGWGKWVWIVFFNFGEFRCGGAEDDGSCWVRKSVFEGNIRFETDFYDLVLEKEKWWAFTPHTALYEENSRYI